MNNKTKYFCVSDIHSFYDPLMSALLEKGFDINDTNHKLIICGDAFDRGDDTIQIFELMKKLQEQDRLIYILGNHEDLLFDCIEELTAYGRAGGHHYHNKTIKTLSHFLKEDDFWMYSTYIPTDTIQKIVENTKDLRDFIIKNGVNYFELGNKIFVHSWLPIYNDIEFGDIVWKDWKKYVNESNDLWKKSRWGNPFLNWKAELYPQDKCIVFGHWHCSYGHSHIDMKTKEWPQQNQEKRFEEAFKPWIKNNAIGIDACVAYSGKINCLVFNEQGDLLE